jgi:hypothetical protein
MRLGKGLSSTRSQGGRRRFRGFTRRRIWLFGQPESLLQ